MSGHGHGNKPAHDNVNRDNFGYEPTDAKATPLVVFTIGLTVFTVAAFIASFGIYRLLEKGQKMIDPPMHPMAVERKIAEGMPRLQINEAADLTEYRQAMDQKVNGYGWINKDASIVRVPVTKAMDLVLKNKELKSRE